MSLPRALILLTGLTGAACTTFLEPTACPLAAPLDPDSPSSKTETTACGGIRDARFCDYIAVSVEGADCPALHLVPSRHFCVVTHEACVDTSYAVRGRDCRVLRYEKVKDSTFVEDCTPGSPFLVNR